MTEAAISNQWEKKIFLIGLFSIFPVDFSQGYPV